MTPRMVRIARRVHRASLVLLPRRFREEFGDDLVDDFERAALDAHRTRGRSGVLRLLTRTLADTLLARFSHRRALGAKVIATARTIRLNNKSGGVEMLRSLFRDTLVGLRMLAHRPTYTVIAVGTLALGIGANAAIFSVVNGVLVRPLPYPQPDELVRLYHVNARTGDDRGVFSVPDREDRVDRTTSLDALAVYSTLPSGPLLTGGDAAAELQAAYVSSGFFEVLGRDAYLGRTLLDSEEQGDNHVVVLSYPFWQTRYGGDESVIGSTITLDDTAWLVTGVMPPDFNYPSPDVEGWIFLSTIDPGSIPLQYRQVRFLDAIGRLADGVTLERATQELSALATGLVAEFPDDNADLTQTALVPLRESITGGVQTTLILLLAAVALVLLIACANVANLLLSRGVERGRELAIRRALGASRGRLVRQLLTESVLLSVGGGVTGVLLALLGTRAMLNRGSGLIPRASEISIDVNVLLFAVLLTTFTALTFGLLPALNITRHTGTERLASATRQGSDRGLARHTWSALVVGQVSLAMLVVVASGLLLRSLWALQRVDVGMNTDRLAVLTLTINDARYPERPQYLAAYERMMEEIDRLPEVESVASIRFRPLGLGGEQSGFSIPGRPELEGADRPTARLLQLSPGFFETAGVPILAGRDFSREDHADAPPVVIINDALRRRYWPGESPIGQSIDDLFIAPMQIIGVAGDVRQAGLAEDPIPTIYVAQAQWPRRGMTFIARTSTDPEAALPAIRNAVLAVDADQPIDEVATMDEVVHGASAQPRFFSLLLASFAVLALLLASIGIYGVVNHSVSRRMSEIGIRVALGAPRLDVVRMVIAGGMRPVLVGTVVGLGLSFAGTRTLQSILYGVSAIDPVTFVAVPTLLTAVAVAACWVPARRAVRIDPTDALRAE